MKKQINPFDYAGYICEAMKKGILVTTKTNDQVNAMTIGWGTIGIEWGKPIFTIFVRESRHTKNLLDESGEFTVNVPMNGSVGNIIGFCGSKSGRDVDKISALGLTLEAPETVSVPGIRELPLTLECKVPYSQGQIVKNLPEDLQTRFYPQRNTPSDNAEDFHTAYYGEIVSAYIIED